MEKYLGDRDEARICAPAFWVPKAHLKGWFTGFGLFLVCAFLLICLGRGLYVTVGDVKDFLGGMR